MQEKKQPIEKYFDARFKRFQTTCLMTKRKGCDILSAWSGKAETRTRTGNLDNCIPYEIKKASGKKESFLSCLLTKQPENLLR